MTDDTAAVVRIRLTQASRLPTLPPVTDSGLEASSHDHPSTPPDSPSVPATSGPVPGSGRPPGLALAWRAPLLAYAVTLGVALVLGILALVALASGDAPTEVEDVSDATDGVLAWLAIPFQLTAMALGGRIGLGNDDFSVSVMALPLLLTATYVVVVGRVARASEARVPSRSRQERALVSGAAAVGAAAVVAVVTRLLALRAEGTSIHALSVSLVVGTLLLTFAADLVGRELHASGVPAVVRRWWPAAAAWLSGVAVWLVVSLPVLVVAMWVEEGFGTALSAPLWWPTVGLWTYAMGHLSGVGTSGFYSYAWSGDGVLVPLALLLGAVLTTVVAAVVWHLRAPRTPGELAAPASWVPLPVAFAVGGVLVTLVPMVSVGGGAFGVSGSLTAMPAAWTCLLLALWGLGAEALSRFAAPRVVPVLPAGVVARLRGPEAAAAAADRPAPEPLSPEQARRVRRTAIVVGAGLGVVVAGAIAVSVVGSMFFSPEKAAEDYLDALADGDVDTVAASTSDGGDFSTALLTDEIAAATDGRPTGFTIDDVTTLGDSAMVEVSADGGVGGDGYLTLTEGGKKFGLFQEWEVEEGLTSTLSVSADTDFSVNGVTVEAADEGYATYVVLPGTYTIQAYADNEWVQAEPSEVDVALGDYASADDMTAEPSDAFRSEVDAQVAAFLDECLASDEVDTDGCPQQLYVYGDVRNLEWEVTEEPTIDYDYYDPTFPVSLYASGGSATATYEVDESYGFGPKQWTEETDESSLDFSLEVDVDGDELVVTPEAY